MKKSLCIGGNQVGVFFFFFLQFCNVANNPQEYLAKFGYRPKSRKIIRILLYFGYLMELDIEI
jgi:hypothetical protein